MPPPQKVNDNRELCLAKGTYLAAPSEEFAWFTVEATKASYLIRASDVPAPESGNRPAPVELSMIIKVAEGDWWFRSDANWKNHPDAGLFEKVKLTFFAGPPEHGKAVEDFEIAKSKLDDLMAMVSNPDVPTTGGFTEKGIKIRHALFGHLDEAAPEDVEKSKFKMTQWPVFTPEAKAAIADIAETHFIRTPPVYDIPGQLIIPNLYAKRLRGATVSIKFTFAHYGWSKSNVFCADLAHLRVLVTPSPLTPVTPRYKRTLDLDPEFPVYKLDLKKAKSTPIEEDE